MSIDEETEEDCMEQVQNTKNFAEQAKKIIEAKGGKCETENGTRIALCVECGLTRHQQASLGNINVRCVSKTHNGWAKSDDHIGTRITVWNREHVDFITGIFVSVQLYKTSPEQFSKMLAIYLRLIGKLCNGEGGWR